MSDGKIYTNGQVWDGQKRMFKIEQYDEFMQTISDHIEFLYHYVAEERTLAIRKCFRTEKVPMSVVESYSSFWKLEWVTLAYVWY